MISNKNRATVQNIKPDIIDTRHPVWILKYSPYYIGLKLLPYQFMLVKTLSTLFTRDHQ